MSGRTLLAARLGFGLLVAAMLLVGAASFFIYFTREGWLICSGSTVECQVKLQYSVQQAADFARRGIPFENVLALRYGALLLSSFVSLGMGLFIAARRSDDWMALLIAFLLISSGTVSDEGITSSLTRAVPQVTLLVNVLSKLSVPALVLAMGLFPNGRLVPAWMRIGLPVMCVSVLIVTTTPTNIPRWLELASAAVVITVFGLLVYSQVLRYRRFSSFAERKETRWAVMGFVLYLLTLAIGVFLFALDPFGDNQLLKAIVGILCFTLLPGVFFAIFLGIAVLRSKLWDIDVLIRRTVTYTLVTALLLIVFFGSVLILQQLFASVTGAKQNELVTVLSTLGIAALFVPLRKRIQAVIDRRFNRARYDTQQVLNDFASTVRDETDLEELTARLMEVVDETMQPKSLSLWLKK